MHCLLTDLVNWWVSEIIQFGLNAYYAVRELCYCLVVILRICVMLVHWSTSDSQIIVRAFADKALKLELVTLEATVHRFCRY